MIWQLSINRSRSFLSFLAAFVQVMVLYSFLNLPVCGYSEEEMYNAKEFDPFLKVCTFGRVPDRDEEEVPMLFQLTVNNS